MKNVSFEHIFRALKAPFIHFRGKIKWEGKISYCSKSGAQVRPIEPLFSIAGPKWERTEKNASWRRISMHG